LAAAARRREVAAEAKRTPEAVFKQQMRRDPDVKATNKAIKRDEKKPRVILRDDEPMDEKHVAPPKPDVVERLIPSYGPGVVDPNGPGPLRRVAPFGRLNSIPVDQPSADMELADSEDEEIKMAAEQSMKEAEERKRKYDAEEQDRKKKHDAEEKAKRTAARLRLAQMANEKAQRELPVPPKEAETPTRAKFLGVTVPAFLQG